MGRIIDRVRSGFGIRGGAAVLVAIAVLLVGACSEDTEVSYDSGAAGGLTIAAGGDGYRDVLEFVSRQGLIPGLKLNIIDAGPDANRTVIDGGADLAFFQIQPAFLGDYPTTAGTTGQLSIVSRVNVAPYALYSSRWKDLKDTGDWVNSGIGADRITGHSLPHGAVVAVPNTTAGLARSLYLLQSANLLRLDRAFGGLTVADLSVTEANILESTRHLALRQVDVSTFGKDALNNYDAVVLDPRAAAAAGLLPERDALAVEPGLGNPYARVLVAPARLAGDERVSQLAHALESRAVADYLKSTYHGAVIAAR